MKKSIGLFFLLLFAAGLWISCNESANNRNQIQNVSMLALSSPYSSASGGSSERVANDAAIEAAFTLDFRPQTAEPESVAEFLTAAELAGAAAEASGQGSIVGGGLRRLADYRIVYYDPAAERARIAAIRAAQEAGRQGQIENLDPGPLTVIDWGPRGHFSSAVQRPSIHVIFSQPMIPVSSLGEQSSTSPFVSIYPPIRGSFRWYGTTFLSFEGYEPAQSQQTYTITVAENATSIFGTRISGERVFTFHTETLSMRNIAPGGEWRGINPRFSPTDVSTELAMQIGVLFNYPIEADHIGQHMQITVGGEVRTFTLRQEGEFRVIATLADRVDFDTEVRVTLLPGARSRGATRGIEAAQHQTFRTPGVFRVISHVRRLGGQRFRNLVEISFTQGLNRDTVLGAISTYPPMPIAAENLEIFGGLLRLVNLPVVYGDRFTVYVSQSVQDVFGRNLSEPWSGNVVMPGEPPPIGSARFLGSGQAMLEAQFAPRFLFEYRNISDFSWYTLASIENPWFRDVARYTMWPRAGEYDHWAIGDCRKTLSV